MLNNRGIKVNGIILKRINYKDSDRILTVFTKELGKITVLAKGVRKMTSKKRGHIEPLCVASLYLIKTGDWYLVTQSESINSFTKLTTTSEKLGMAITSLEALDKITEREQPSQILYRLVIKTLIFLEGESDIHIFAAYLIKILKINGFYEYGNLIKLFESYQTEIQSNLRIYCHDLEKLKYEEIVKKYSKDDMETALAALKALPNYFELYADIRLKSLSNIN